MPASSILKPSASSCIETARVWRHKLDQRLRPLGLSQAKWRTIAHLANGQLTQCELADRLGIEEPTLARSSPAWKATAGSNARTRSTIAAAKRCICNASPAVCYSRSRRPRANLRHELLATISPGDLQTCLRVLTEIRARRSNCRRGAARQTAIPQATKATIMISASKVNVAAPRGGRRCRAPASAANGIYLGAGALVRSSRFYFFSAPAARPRKQPPPPPRPVSVAKVIDERCAALSR